MSAGAALAQFLHYYPGLYAARTWGPSWRRRPWETRDGIVPARLFFLLYAELDAVTAREEMTGALAAGAAIGNALGGEDDRASAALDALIDRAFPPG
ncbi:MAG: hypothetical protein LC798_13455 [Chloroflexi bacterium]|nr:hypothetical protein [Chloroflexota bacterium]